MDAAGAGSKEMGVVGGSGIFRYNHDNLGGQICTEGAWKLARFGTDGDGGMMIAHLRRDGAFGKIFGVGGIASRVVAADARYGKLS